MSCESICLKGPNVKNRIPEKNVDAKPTIEEAMTAAFVRTCNKCKKQFMKEYGCNKMTCLCGNSQCFVCSQDVIGYDHFSPETYPQYDDTEKRLHREVAAAQAEAVRNVLQKRTDLTEAELTVDRYLLGEAKQFMAESLTAYKIVHPGGNRALPDRLPMTLIEGAYGGYERTICQLLEQGVDIDGRDKDGKTALMWQSSMPSSRIFSFIGIFLQE